MKKNKFSKYILVYCVVYISLFIPFVLIVNLIGNNVSDILIQYTFLFFGVEVLVLGGIKITKVITELIKLAKCKLD